jgi:hypothetical protein
VSTDDELLDRLRKSLAPVVLAPPPAGVAALRAAAERGAAAAAQPRLSGVRAHGVRLRATASAAHVRRRPVPRWRRPALAAAAAALVVGVGYAGGRLLRADPPAGGVVEYAGPMTAPDGSVGARVTVEKFGIGRVISFDSDALPILPTGELYEVWFVGPADGPGAPDRISAGTFHPDAQGRSSVRLVAAVDPALYPRMVVTAEPSGGDPATNGPEVLEATISAEL